MLDSVRNQMARLADSLPSMPRLRFFSGAAKATSITLGPLVQFRSSLDVAVAMFVLLLYALTLFVQQVHDTIQSSHALASALLAPAKPDSQASVAISHKFSGETDTTAEAAHQEERTREAEAARAGEDHKYTAGPTEPPTSPIYRTKQEDHCVELEDDHRFPKQTAGSLHPITPPMSPGRYQLQKKESGGQLKDEMISGADPSGSLE